MRSIVHALTVLALATPVAAQEVAYTIAFPNALHREAEVSVAWSGLPAGPVEVRMSRASPGRYALHEFAKNVYAVRAVDGTGRALEVEQPDPYGWTVRGHDGTVRFSYTLYGDRTDGTYTAIDGTHAHLNMPATFAFARGTEMRPIRITFEVPAGSGWKVATQLQPTERSHTFTAPHLQYFLDSPTEVSDFVLREWPVTHEGETHTIRLAVHHSGTAAEVDAYTEMAKAVVAEQIAMWGEPADYDFGTYTFIADYLPYASGDGMEHRNSTILTSSGSLADNALGVLGTLSHEFFHSWNVERLRPADLEPFDFELANMSDLLWFAEGFTSYYDGLFIRRAGLLDDGRFAGDLSNLLNGVLPQPGRRYFSPVEMSRQAPFVDAAVSIDPNNRSNTFISYYTWGAVVGLGLDLTLRTRFPGTTLDDFMRAMWTKYGQHQENLVPTRPYTIDDLRATLAEVTGDAAFAAEFFEQYIEGRDVPDFEALLARGGFVLRPVAPDAASFGQVPLQVRDDKLTVVGSSPVGSPAYEAGLDRGDVLVSLDGQPVRTSAQVGELIAAKRPGDTVTVVFEHRGGRRTASVELVADPRLEIVPFETAGRPITEAIRVFRADWLESKAR